MDADFQAQVERLQPLYQESLDIITRHEINPAYLRVRGWGAFNAVGWTGSAWEEMKATYTADPKMATNSFPLSWIEWPSEDEAQGMIQISERQSLLLVQIPREHEYRYSKPPDPCVRCGQIRPDLSRSRTWGEIEPRCLDQIVPYTPWVIQSLGLPL